MFKLVSTLLATTVFSFSVSASTVFWSVDLDGILIKNNGEIAVSVIQDSPSNPGPSNNVWDDSCRFLYFHRDANGNATSDLVRSEMMRAGNTATLTGRSVRVGVYKLNGDSRCYTTQLWVN